MMQDEYRSAFPVDWVRLWFGLMPRFFGTEYCTRFTTVIVIVALVTIDYPLSLASGPLVLIMYATDFT